MAAATAAGVIDRPHARMNMKITRQLHSRTPMFPKKLPPFLLRRGCGGQVGLVIHCACAADDAWQEPRSLKRKALFIFLRH